MSKKDKNLFMRCQGKCRICFDEGGCSLENKIKNQSLERIRKEIYNN